MRLCVCMLMRLIVQSMILGMINECDGWYDGNREGYIDTFIDLIGQLTYASKECYVAKFWRINETCQ